MIDWNRWYLRLNWIAEGLTIAACVAWWSAVQTTQLARALGIIPEVIVGDSLGGVLMSLFAVRLLGVVLAVLIVAVCLWAAISVGRSPWATGWPALVAYGVALLLLMGTLFHDREALLHDPGGMAALAVYVALTTWSAKRALLRK